MSEKQIWQAEGLGTDKGTVETVLRIFTSDGVQGIESQQALERYIGKLSDDRLRDMCVIDEEAALQLFVDCFGARMAFEKVMQILGYVTVETAQRMGWISPAAYAEVVGKYEERTKRLEDEKRHTFIKMRRRNTESGCSRKAEHKVAKHAGIL